jgi:hypothetical protein
MEKIMWQLIQWNAHSNEDSMMCTSVRTVEFTGEIKLKTEHTEFTSIELTSTTKSRWSPTCMY